MDQELYNELKKRHALSDEHAFVVTLAFEYLPENVKEIARYCVLWVSYNQNLYAHRFSVPDPIEYVIFLTDNITAEKLGLEEAIKVVLHEIAHCREERARQGVAKFLELTFSCIHTRI